MLYTNEEIDKLLDFLKREEDRVNNYNWTEEGYQGFVADPKHAKFVSANIDHSLRLLIIDLERYKQILNL